VILRYLWLWKKSKGQTRTRKAEM